MTRDDFLNDAEETFAHGDDGEGVEILQRLLLEFGFDPHGIDGSFGRLTEKALADYQWARMLPAIGSASPTTKTDMSAALGTGWYPGQPFTPWPIYLDGERDVHVIGGYHAVFGRIPAREGKMSTFGGPDDAGDRIYGQALVAANNAAELYDRHPALVEMGVFTEGHSDPLPMTTDWKGRVRRAGISYMLNPESFYVAMRWRKPRPSALTSRVVVLTDEGKAVCCTATDWGPAQSTGRVIDISPGAEEALGITTDSMVRIAWGIDGAPLGPL